MNALPANSISMARATGKMSAAVGYTIALLFVVMASLSPASAAEVPSDDEQDVLIRTTLMTFNDANMTGNYSVLLAKASKQFQSQFTAEKLAASFEPFRSKELFFEDVVTEDYASADKATIDAEGALLLAGAFKTDEMEVKYRLRFVQNNKLWKLLGINVNATRN